MPILGSWIRESDEALFQRFLSRHPEIVVRNARREPVDPAELDALLLTGGPDIAVPFHNVPIAEPQLIRDPEPERDDWELAAARQAFQRGLPIFAICKGLQVLNVALGGDAITGHSGT